jgi:putative Mg2+ transporter-C (MgtC) family protein
MGPYVFDSAASPSLLYGQGWVQVGQLLLAFALSSMIAVERQWKDKNAGLRIYSSVGTSAALLTLIGKYGFMDVIITGQLAADPSRVAAQIVTGVGFLGAGLIITHRGTVSGLTTAATMWETAAIGIAAGAGLWLLAVAVTVLHFAKGNSAT